MKARARTRNFAQAALPRSFEFDDSLAPAFACGSISNAHKSSRIFNILRTQPVNITRAARVCHDRCERKLALASVATQSGTVYFSPHFRINGGSVKDR
jgi:hypothetical protein